MVRVLAAAVLLVLCAAAPAGAKPLALERSRHLWATVNVCDTAKHPDAIGVRGSMPGTRRTGERMFMRFRVQYRSTTDGVWKDVQGPGGRSALLPVGSAKWRARQAGRIFEFDAPAAGTTLVLRGVVRFEWRKDGRLVRSAAKRTSAGHRSAAGADPRDYSAATCELR